MFSLIKFNFYRTITSKFIIISFAAAFLLCTILWSVWVNLPIPSFNFWGQFLQWFTFGIIVLYISLLNITLVSNIMISDVENGIFSLEIRKGINYQVALWLKLLVVKIIIWTTLCFLTLMFLIIVLMANPIQKELFIKGFIPGYLAFFAYDIIFTGILLLFGCTLNTKLLISISTFIAAIFALSPILGTIHFALNTQSDRYFSSTRQILPLEVQDIATQNPDGIVKFLFDETVIFNNLDIIKAIEKQPSSSNEMALSFEDINSGLTNENGMFRSLINYYLGFAQPLEITTYLNKNQYLGWNAEFDFSDEYMQSNIYKFFELTRKNDQAPNLEDTVFGSISKKNIYASNQLGDYFAYISSDAMVQQLESNFKLKNVSQDLKKLEKIFRDYFYLQTNRTSYPFVQVGDVFSSTNKVWLVNGNGANYNNNLGRTLNYQMYITDFTKDYEKIKMFDGNQLYFMILLQLLGEVKAISANTGIYAKENSFYQLITSGNSELYGLFLSNPLISLPYMSITSGTTPSDQLRGPLINNRLIEFLRTGLSVQDVGLIPNSGYVETNSLKPFTGFDNLPIYGYIVTNKVINPVWYYLVYLLLGISFATIAHFVYIRKVKP